MRAHTCLLAAIHQDVLIISIHALNGRQEARRHTNALKVSPKSFPRKCVSYSHCPTPILNLR
eukprot:1147300-Pelagomonas_calceolata.AAC.1